MRISSISSEVGMALQPAASTKRVDPTAVGPATSADDATNQSKQVVNAAELGTVQVSSNQGEGAIRLVINGQGQGLKFSVDKETGQYIIAVIDTESGEVIRQIPPGEVLNFLRQLEHRKGTVLSIKS